MIKLYRSWGCDIVNMTTVPEVVLAKEAGLSYVAVALVTDYDCWRDNHGVVDQASVMQVSVVMYPVTIVYPLLLCQVFAQNVSRVKTLVEKVIVSIGNNDWTETIEANRQLAQSSIMGSM